MTAKWQPLCLSLSALRGFFIIKRLPGLSELPLEAIVLWQQVLNLFSKALLFYGWTMTPSVHQAHSSSKCLLAAICDYFLISGKSMVGGFHGKISSLFPHARIWSSWLWPCLLFVIWNASELTTKMMSVGMTCVSSLESLINQQI